MKAVLLALVGGLVLAGPFVVSDSALGHASLVGTEPDRGARLEEPPERVVFEFSEEVETGLGSVDVFDSSGAALETGPATSPSDDRSRVAVDLPAGLGDGIYTAVYRVVSADAHPVSGGFTFIVGEPGAVSSPAVADLLEMKEAGPVTDAAFWLVRWLGWLGVAGVTGALLCLLLLGVPSRAGPGLPATGLLRGTEGPIGLLLAGSAVLVLATSVTSLPLQGATGAGTSFWDAFDRGTVDAVLGTGFGRAASLRLLGVLALIPLIAVLLWKGHPGDGPDRGRSLVAPGALATLALLLFAAGAAVSGHAATQGAGWLVQPAAALHAGAMAVWAGGLCAIAFVLPRTTAILVAPEDKTAVLTTVLLRFSTVALVCVAVLAATGTVQALAAVEAAADLVDTGWGRALVAKVLLFAVLIGLGAVMRSRVIPALVARRADRSSPGAPGRSARRVLRADVLLAAAVLALTAVLVTYPPPGSVASGPVSGSIDLAGDRLEYTVEPASVGSNEMHVYLFDGVTGQPVNPLSARVEFSQPEAGIPAFEGEVRRAGPGHFLLPSVTFGVPGDWEARVALRTSRFTERSGSFGFEVE